MTGFDETYTPKVPTVEQVDGAIALLREHHANALERPDYIDGMLGALVAINTSVRALAAAHPAITAVPLGDLLLQSFSQNLGDNFELYRAVRDTLYPLDGTEAAQS